MDIPGYCLLHLIERVCFNPNYAVGDIIDIGGTNYPPVFALLRLMSDGETGQARSVLENLLNNPLSTSRQQHPWQSRSSSFAVDSAETLRYFDEWVEDFAFPNEDMNLSGAYRRESIRHSLLYSHVSAQSLSYGHTKYDGQNPIPFEAIRVTKQIHDARLNLSERAKEHGVFYTDVEYDEAMSEINLIRVVDVIRNLTDIFLGEKGIFKKLGFCPIVEPAIGVALVQAGTSGSFNDPITMALMATDNRGEVDRYAQRSFFYISTNLIPRFTIIVNALGLNNRVRTTKELTAVAVEEVVQGTIYALTQLCLPPGMGFYFEEQYAQRILDAIDLGNVIPEAEKTHPNIPDADKAIADKLLDEIWASEEDLTVATLKVLLKFRDEHLEYFPDRQLLIKGIIQQLKEQQLAS